MAKNPSKIPPSFCSFPHSCPSTLSTASRQNGTFVSQCVLLLSVALVVAAAIPAGADPFSADQRMSSMNRRFLSTPRKRTPLSRHCPLHEDAQRALTKMVVANEADMLPPRLVPAHGQRPQKERNSFLQDTLMGCPVEEAEQQQSQSPFDEIAPGMPLELRSLCNFVYVDNIDERRLPKKITEMKCICDRPSRVPGGGGLRCEPLQYEVPVLVFDEHCAQFKQRLQRVTLACVAVLPTSARTGFAPRMGEAQEAEYAVRR